MSPFKQKINVNYTLVIKLLLVILNTKGVVSSKAFSDKKKWSKKSILIKAFLNQHDEPMRTAKITHMIATMP